MSVRRTVSLLVLILGALAAVACLAVPSAATAATTSGRVLADNRGPVAPTAPADPKSPTVTVDLNGVTGSKPSTSITVILGITLLSVAPALLLMMTSFTKIVVVLGLSRNALGLQGVPPNQVLVGLALFLSLFVMSPVLTKVNSDAVQPYLKGDMTQSAAVKAGVAPLREFMLNNTRKDELAMLSKVADRKLPATRADVALTTLIPAFVISELKSAFIIGFIIFVPFLVIDIVVSAALMSMGMMMLPPVMISLPFKLLLFILVDGWGLIITALVQSYQ
jgi:flagellar biosynthesis protein FliP